MKTGLARFLDRAEPVRSRSRRRLPSQHALPLRFGAEALDQALAAYEAGSSSRDVAEALGISKTGFLDLLRERGVTVRARLSLSPSQVDEAARLYGSGLLLREIGERSASAGTVCA